MHWYADLHLHSKYSLATSPRMDLETMAKSAAKKGLSVLATGDILHPTWFEHISNTLQERDGLFGLTPYDVEFILQTEVSTIYKKAGKTRKVHHLIFFPSLCAASSLTRQLSRFGKLHTDGRPTLSLSSKELLECVLEAKGFLVPAHIWTPWYGVLGSKSGFNAIQECYEELSSHIFAVETGLSSDPPMNRRVSFLDCYRLISASDAHSSEKMGRKATIFSCTPSFSGIRASLETGEGLVGTAELFPEAGKYFLDGHRTCTVSFSPEQAERLHNRCPHCHKPLTQGVLHRVEELADRKRPLRSHCRYHVPLLDLVVQQLGYTTHSKKAHRLYEELLENIGPELYILHDAPIENMGEYPQLARALTKIRKGHVRKEAGFDGVYGKIMF